MCPKKHIFLKSAMLKLRCIDIFMVSLLFLFVKKAQHFMRGKILMKDLTLVVLAAGMGSRFGGLKQLQPVGENGEFILDYSVSDAVNAGFNKVVYIIKKEHEDDFRNTIGKRTEKIIKTEYAYQDINDLPEGFSVPEGREKPWGTGHALLCAKDKVTTPFAVINADDYYGTNSMKIVADALKEDVPACMVGFKLGNTLSENGTVSRGVCEVKDGYLAKVTEHTALDKNSGIPLDTLVSMNMWGLKPSIFEELEKGFVEFLENNDNPLKGEYFLPGLVDSMISRDMLEVKMLTTDDKWYGMTYKEELEMVKQALSGKKIY